MPMKALILSCGTGGGHNEAGKAVCEALRLRGHEAVFFKDYLRLAGKRTDQVVCNYRYPIGTIHNQKVNLA